VKLKRPLYGPDEPKGPSRGSDVVAIKRALSKVETDFFPRPAAGFDEVYNRKTAAAVKVFQRLNKIEATGDVGQPTLDALVPFMDSRARSFYTKFELPPAEPKLVEPYQGFESLHHELWDAYSLGRTEYALGDGPGLASGTYNPASTLPSGAKSDHAFFPAWAFDLDIGPDTGFANVKARGFFEELVRRQAELGIEYVILGDKIWSRAKGLHAYTGGGHENHVHVSGSH
jgi:hypothetical protein